MIPITLTNSLSRKKETFKPQEEGRVSLYVCGVTPYDFSHIGHGRSYVNFDVLVRLLKLVGFDVTYVRNVTDIDDKLLNRAEQETGSSTNYSALAQKYTTLYQEDMASLNCLKPEVEPLATEHIDEMINFIADMIAKGDAYTAGPDVYFDVSKAQNYGQLSGKKLDEMQAGARIEINEKKKNPFDFVLWKGNNDGSFWKAPWGFGRPGWHIECSAMAHKYLGVTLDIHGGGQDLLFPHHENEIAQSVSFTNKPFVNYWLHNALVNIGKEKMSKSLGNIFKLREVFKTFDPMVLRFYFLQHHYRTPIEFSLDHVSAAQVAYKKLITLFDGIKPLQESLGVVQSDPVCAQFIQALADDLNTPRAIGVVFENSGAIKNDKQLAGRLMLLVNQALGLTLEKQEDEVVITDEIKDLLEKREQARSRKDWATADALRDKLKELGYNPQDKKL